MPKEIIYSPTVMMLLKPKLGGLNDSVSSQPSGCPHGRNFKNWAFTGPHFLNDLSFKEIALPIISKDNRGSCGSNPIHPCPRGAVVTQESSYSVPHVHCSQKNELCPCQVMSVIPCSSREWALAKEGAAE